MSITEREGIRNTFNKSLQGRILVIGATGNVGRHVVSQLLNIGNEVCAMVFDPGAADLHDDVEVMRGDLADPDIMEGCLAGIEAVFLDWPYDRRAGRFLAAESAPAVVDAVARHACRIVFISSHGVRDDIERSNVPATASYTGLERLIERSGLEWTFLRLCMPASITLNWAAQIRADGIVRGPYAASARSLIHERDVAAVAIRALVGDGHCGAKYLLTGAESLTHTEQVRIIGEAIGRQLHYVEIPREAAREALLTSWPPSLADSVLDAMAARVTEPELITRAVEEITGAPPRTFREWVDEHIDHFR